MFNAILTYVAYGILIVLIVGVCIYKLCKKVYLDGYRDGKLRAHKQHYARLAKERMRA